ncbi:hypothetical protein MKX41_31025 [Paenibacillus sp. FSL R5-0475]|uniref:hypothetical protein n=1 Tax=Paenibacillus sp. FSL R5-0475 TaxID=2921643 RepID=UPI0030F591CD
MAKVKTVNWCDFFIEHKRLEEPVITINLDGICEKITKSVMKKETLIKVAGITLLLLIGLPDTSHAATGIDAVADKLYKKLLNVGKWIIIMKGGIDTIQSAIQGDVQSAKKNFLGYLLVYVVLWALPWGLKQVDVVFADMGA